MCGGSGLAAWCSNGSGASSGSLLPGGTLHKKAPDAGHSYMVKEEPYDVYKQAVMDAFPEDITEDSIKLSAEIPKQTLCKWAVKGKPQKISITVEQFVWGF